MYQGCSTMPYQNGALGFLASQGYNGTFSARSPLHWMKREWFPLLSSLEGDGQTLFAINSTSQMNFNMSLILKTHVMLALFRSRHELKGRIQMNQTST